MPGQQTVPRERLEWLKAAHRVDMAFKALSFALAEELKYRPDQPRAPRGTPIGGQWIDDPATVRGPLRLPVPGGQRNTGFEEVRIAADERPYVLGLGSIIRFQMTKLPQSLQIGNRQILVTYPPATFPGSRHVGPHSIRRPQHHYMQFESFSDFKVALGNAPTGFQWHHIVEQRLAGSMFPPQRIHNTDNIVLLPTRVHYCVNGKLSRVQLDTGYPYRYTLQTTEFDSQFETGLEIVKSCLVEVGQ